MVCPKTEIIEKNGIWGETRGWGRDKYQGREIDGAQWPKIAEF